MTDDRGLCGVVVTYHPDNDAIENLRKVMRECGRVVVVDNASPLEVQRRIAAMTGIELITLSENVGIAAALNIGAGKAAEAGRKWVVTFDQDSQPAGGMVDALWSAHVRHPQAAVIGPRIVEAVSANAGYRWVRRHPRGRWLFQRVRCGNDDLTDVTDVVTSGSLIDLSLWRALGGFDEGLFIDYVDVDFCLKARRAGRTIVVAAAAVLHHQLGRRRPGLLWGKDFRPMHHAPFRHYYMARNRVRVWRRHALAVPHWAVFDLCFAGYNGVRVLMFEAMKWTKLKAIVLGTWDGLRGSIGPIPARRRRVMDKTGDSRVDPSAMNLMQ